MRFGDAVFFAYWAEHNRTDDYFRLRPTDLKLNSAINEVMDKDRPRCHMLLHTIACSSYNSRNGTLIYSTQFLHRQNMSIIVKQNQHNTELPSLVQHDETQAFWLKLSKVFVCLFDYKNPTVKNP